MHHAWHGGTERGYVPKCTTAHSQGGQKFRLFAFVIVPNQKRVIKKLAKLLKPSYILAKLEAATGGGGGGPP